MAWGLSDLYDKVSSAAGEAVSAVAEAAVDVADAAVDGLGASGEVVGAVIGAAATVADAATGGLAGEALHVLDDTVLDATDYVTGGVVDIDYDGGQFSARVGIDDIAEVGASVGEHGVTAEATTFAAGTSVRLTDEGFDYSAQAGVDFGPLPYSETTISIDPDGDGSFHHRAHAVLPTPYGLLDAEGEVDVARADGAWGISGRGSGVLHTPTGVNIAASGHASYQENADGDSALSVGLAGSVSKPGIGTVGGGVGYERLEIDGIVLEKAHANAYVDGFGARIDANADYLAVTTEDGSESSWDTDVDAGGWAGTAVDYASKAVTELDEALVGADEIEQTTDQLFSDV